MYIVSSGAEEQSPGGSVGLREGDGREGTKLLRRHSGSSVSDLHKPKLQRTLFCGSLVYCVDRQYLVTQAGIVLCEISLHSGLVAKLIGSDST